MAPPPERLPPHSLDAEEALLGSIMLDPSIVSRISATLRSIDFYRERNATVYQAMLDLYEKQRPIDYLTLMEALDEGGLTEQIGGLTYLTGLLGVVPTPINADTYAATIIRAAQFRRLISVGGKIAQAGFQAQGDANEAVEWAEALLAQVSAPGQTQTFVPLTEGLVAYMEELEAIRADGDAMARIPSGFIDLDAILQGGFGKSDLIILGARPSMGKTALSLQVSQAAGYLYGKSVVFFSLEMSLSQLVGRMIASTSGVDLLRLRNPKADLQEFELRRVGDALGQLAETRLLIDDSPTLTVSSLRSRVRLLQQTQTIDMIVVDHLQMLVPGGGSINRNQEVEEAARQLKALAREMNIPVIILSQLSRATEQGRDKRPMLSNLRDSGGIEQYADVVILLYRDDYYNKDSDQQGRADLIIAKHRNGPTGETSLYFIQRTTRFLDIGTLLERSTA